MMILLRLLRSPTAGKQPANRRHTTGERPHSRRRPHLVTTSKRRSARATARDEQGAALDSSTPLASDGLWQSFYALLDDEDPEGALRDLTVPSKREE
jgi:hypothetical protein